MTRQPATMSVAAPACFSLPFPLLVTDPEVPDYARRALQKYGFTHAVRLPGCWQGLRASDLPGLTFEAPKVTP